MTERTQGKEHIISGVEAASIAEETGIEAGDVLLSINGKEIRDIFDYRMACQQEEILVLIRKGSGAAQDAGEEWELEIEKDPFEDLGITFARGGLMDDYRSCCNGCVFCFIDQMPKGMRKTLYFKDDDARLSFLQGNYVTLTNLTDSEIDRILEYHLSPINVSFHTTNPELRCKMLRHPKAGEALEKAKRLAAEGTGIELNGQIVLCKGLNDGAELDRTMRDLLNDYAPGLVSVSVVPVGITKHREKLYPLEPFTPEDACAVLGQIHAFQEEALRLRGTRLIHPGDEWYLLAVREELENPVEGTSVTELVNSVIPPEEDYEGYPQLENGVGMTRLMMEEFRDALQILTESDNDIVSDIRVSENEISFVTGVLFYPVLLALFSEAAALAPQRRVHLYPIRNDFFGEHITVAGLLTGGDILRQLEGKPLGESLFLPSTVLRAGEEVLLDDVTMTQIGERLKVRVRSSGTSGYDLAAAYFGLPEGYFDAVRGGRGFEEGVNPYELKE